jgi:hypothetical protein
MALNCRFCLLSVLATISLLVGCRDSKITDYRVPKEPDSTPQALPSGHPAIQDAAAPPVAGTGMASMTVPTATDQPLVWTAPASWAPKALSSMRKGSYTVNGSEGSADLSITAFPGDVGGSLANVNRWLGQLGLPSVPELKGAVQPLDANGLNMLVFEGANNGTRMLGVIVPRQGETWFFKLTGPDPLVAREKPAFLEFLKTVRTP